MKTTELAVLLSGSGSTLQNLIDRIADGSLAAKVNLVIASRPDAGGIERARRAGIFATTIARKEFPDVDRFNDAIHEELNRHRFDLVIMAGFLSPFQLRGIYKDRVFNVHPALIPAFCGKGYYGMKVHSAVIESGVKLTGCTVHFADEEYDHGPIILQEPVRVLDDDTPESLAARVQEVERQLYPEAIRLWGENRLRIEGRRVRILPGGSR
jgi:formyltetrahydrofolate-dependent phosphoribosylglycinamide formyltransferase